MLGMDVRIANCDVHDKRGVVAEVKLKNGQIILLCYPVLRDRMRAIEKKYKELGEDLEGDQQTSPKRLV